VLLVADPLLLFFFFPPCDVPCVSSSYLPVFLRIPKVDFFGSFKF
jgi:hypothetical protein